MQEGSQINVLLGAKGVGPGSQPWGPFVVDKLMQEDSL